MKSRTICFVKFLQKEENNASVELLPWLRDACTPLGRICKSNHVHKILKKLWRQIINKRERTGGKNAVILWPFLSSSRKNLFHEYNFISSFSWLWRSGTRVTNNGSSQPPAIMRQKKSISSSIPTVCLMLFSVSHQSILHQSYYKYTAKQPKTLSHPHLWKSGKK